MVISAIQQLEVRARVARVASARKAGGLHGHCLPASPHHNPPAEPLTGLPARIATLDPQSQTPPPFASAHPVSSGVHVKQRRVSNLVQSWRGRSNPPPHPARPVSAHTPGTGPHVPPRRRLPTIKTATVRHRVRQRLPREKWTRSTVRRALLRVIYSPGNRRRRRADSSLAAVDGDVGRSAAIIEEGGRRG